ncbi:MAG: hypothetical protein HQL51_09970 [Magnetococcales bacterium]|nr:hypothetical protein [Magnetococcales bacterium]
MVERSPCCVVGNHPVGGHDHAGWLTRGKDKEGSGWRSAAIAVGLTLAVLSLMMAGYHAAEKIWKGDIIALHLTLYYSVIAAVLSVWLGFMADINRISMHRYYHDRLREAFMPSRIEMGPPYGDDECSLSPTDPNLFELSDLACAYKKNNLVWDVQTPYHLINTTLSVMTSSDAKHRGRGGENFIFSPLYCGSKATGYRQTKDYADGKFTLATAFTISGAAVDPNTGATRFGPLALLMTLFNVRLGYWATNPNRDRNKQSRSSLNWFYLIMREMFQTRMHENASHVHLSDGGHFENLAAYELIRRKCKLIVIGDAGADPKCTYDTLGLLVEKVRVDFGVRITIDTSPMNPRDKKEDRLQRSQSPYVVGTIHYPGEKGKIPGVLVYLNTVMFDGLPEDINTYKRMNPEFPEQTTADQFFDEVQFDAYRELGYQAGLRMIWDASEALELKTTAGDPLPHPWREGLSNPQPVPWKSLSSEQQKELKEMLNATKKVRGATPAG